LKAWLPVVWPPALTVAARLVPAPAGNVHTTCVFDAVSTGQSAPPTAAVGADPKLLPVSVSSTAPAVGPLDGESEDNVGASVSSNAGALCCPARDTTTCRSRPTPAGAEHTISVCP
jgi:hypothetical protein